MEPGSNHHQAITDDEISEKILQGGNLAIQRLIERKRKEDGYLVISENGKVVKIKAKDIPLPGETATNNNAL